MMTQGKRVRGQRVGGERGSWHAVSPRGWGGLQEGRAMDDRDGKEGGAAVDAFDLPERDAAGREK